MPEIYRLKLPLSITLPFMKFCHFRIIILLISLLITIASCHGQIWMKTCEQLCDNCLHNSSATCSTHLQTFNSRECKSTSRRPMQCSQSAWALQGYLLDQNGFWCKRSEIDERANVNKEVQKCVDLLTSGRLFNQQSAIHRIDDQNDVLNTSIVAAITTRRSGRSPNSDQIKRWKLAFSGDLAPLTRVLSTVSCDWALHKLCLHHISCRELWKLFRQSCVVDAQNQCQMTNKNDCWQAFEGLTWTGLGSCACPGNNSDCHWIRLQTNYNKCIYELNHDVTWRGLQSFATVPTNFPTPTKSASYSSTSLLRTTLTPLLRTIPTPLPRTTPTPLPGTTSTPLPRTTLTPLPRTTLTPLPRTTLTLTPLPRTTPTSLSITTPTPLPRTILTRPTTYSTAPLPRPSTTRILHTTPTKPKPTTTTARMYNRRYQITSTTIPITPTRTTAATKLPYQLSQTWNAQHKQKHLNQSDNAEAARRRAAEKREEQWRRRANANYQQRHSPIGTGRANVYDNSSNKKWHTTLEFTTPVQAQNRVLLSQPLRTASSTTSYRAQNTKVYQKSSQKASTTPQLITYKVTNQDPSEGKMESAKNGYHVYDTVSEKANTKNGISDTSTLNQTNVTLQMFPTYKSSNSKSTLTKISTRWRSSGEGFWLSGDVPFARNGSGINMTKSGGLDTGGDEFVLAASRQLFVYPGPSVYGHPSTA